ncbi:hypothetical protein COLO4_15250 [Corchorus olitorius]|uniref:Uncharacterized protein n=1 Tax=Corchorus olitorius TaxID=93759 RepID=A0A1R3JNK1_9ROSI|nr:hypothetical protein COLO4_15250 [Corchorus olitorius]
MSLIQEELFIEYRVLDVISAKVKASDALITEALDLREVVKIVVAKGLEKNWHIGAVIEDIQVLVNSIENKEVKLISRRANLAADWFVKQSRQEMS